MLNEIRKMLSDVIFYIHLQSNRDMKNDKIPG